MSLPMGTVSFDEEQIRLEQRFKQRRVQLNCEYDSEFADMETSLDQIRAKLKQDLAAGVTTEEQAEERQKRISDKRLEQLSLLFKHRLAVMKLDCDEQRDLERIRCSAQMISAQFCRRQLQQIDAKERESEQKLKCEQEDERQKHRLRQLKVELEKSRVTAAEYDDAKLLLERDCKIRHLKCQLDHRFLTAQQYEVGVDSAFRIYNAGIEAARQVGSIPRSLPTGVSGKCTKSVEVIKRIRESSGTASRVDCTDEIVNFLTCLRGVSLSEDVLSLPEGVLFEGRPAVRFLRGKLLVRECYRKLSELLVGMVAANETGKMQRTNFIVRGNPGIGKSLFSYFMVCTLMKLGKTVVWEPANADIRVCITKDSIECVEGRNGFFGQLCDRSCWYIVDGRPPKSVVANTVLVCSFRKEHWYPSWKRGAVLLYMPVWTWDEVKKAHGLGLARSSKQADELALGTVEDLFSKWGGIPRRVFEHGGDDDPTGLLETAIAGAELDVLQMFSTQSEKRDSLNHHMLHVTVDEKEYAEDKRPSNPFEASAIVFASRYVRDRVTDKFLRSDRARLMAFLSADEKAPVAITLRELLFEGVSHKFFSEGGSFRVSGRGAAGGRRAEDGGQITE